MKKLLIYSDAKFLSDREAKLYNDILKSLNIRTEIKDLDPSSNNHVLADLLEIPGCTCRVLNVVKDLVGTMSMPISEFIEQYSPQDLLEIRNFGKESCRILKVCFAKLGYNWQ